MEEDGLPAFDRVVSHIRGLKEAGIDVKLNVSLTPYNAGDMEKIYQIAHEPGNRETNPGRCGNR